ncbi:MAG: hypothetical protein NTZ65_03250 [Candidatus Berkelbacteria bacterium]|nr:hypothetical protein [Candidatus Berkelbacteria bacterium]
MNYQLQVVRESLGGVVVQRLIVDLPLCLEQDKLDGIVKHVIQNEHLWVSPGGRIIVCGCLTQRAQILFVSHLSGMGVFWEVLIPDRDGYLVVGGKNKEVIGSFVEKDRPYSPALVLISDKTVCPDCQEGQLTMYKERYGPAFGGGKQPVFRCSNCSYTRAIVSQGGWK